MVCDVIRVRRQAHAEAVEEDDWVVPVRVVRIQTVAILPHTRAHPQVAVRRSVVRSNEPGAFQSNLSVPPVNKQNTTSDELPIRK